MSEHVFISVHQKHTHMISDDLTTGQLRCQLQCRWCPGQSQTKFASCRSSMSRIFVSYMHNCK